MDNTSILIFKAIVGFISDLNEEFGQKYKSIALYNRLLDKTGIVNVGPVHKHIDCFRSFFIKNKNGMEEKNIAHFEDTKISYSKNVYVDIAVILKDSHGGDNSSIIWKHLLTIWGLVDPTSQAKRILHDSIKNSNGSDKESKFLSDILERVEKTVSDKTVDTSNPMATVSTLMSSGVFTDLINGMQTGLSDGSLDISKLMGSVQGMMSKMNGGSPGGGGMPDLSAMMNMMGNMGGGGGAGGMPDLSAMMSALPSMMSGMGMGGSSGSSSSNAQIEEEKKE